MNKTLIDAFLKKLQEEPETIAFSDTMAVIDNVYTFTPTTFKNGTITNKVGENSGSCKLFAFAKLMELSEGETLQCFGTYYRNDVLKNMEGESHQNIRTFMKFGWAGIEFDNQPLEMK